MFAMGSRAQTQHKQACQQLCALLRIMSWLPARIQCFKSVCRNPILTSSYMLTQIFNLLSVNALDTETFGKRAFLVCGFEPLTNSAVQAEDMQGVGGDAAEISALILDLAQSLKADGQRDSAAGSLKAIHAQLDQLLQQLPTSFFEPLISRDSLSTEQVGLAAQVSLGEATATEPSIAGFNPTRWLVE